MDNNVVSKINFLPLERECLKEAEVMCKKGISLISLIITIIVIIILAAIVIFNGFGTTESARFAKYTQEISNYEDEAQQKYMDEKVKSSIENENRANADIYGEIGVFAGDVNALARTNALQEGFQGTKCYKLVDKRDLYQGQTGAFITDKGEVFTLPGYRYDVNNEERYYISPTKYYTKVANLTDTISVGDYVEYEGEVGNTFDAGELDGYDEPNVQELENLDWRVWSTNEATGEIVIIPTDSVGCIFVNGFKGFVNLDEMLEGTCDIYANSNYNVTPVDIRNLRTFDIQSVSNIDKIGEKLDEDGPCPAYGQLSSEYFENSGYTSGTFYVAENGHSILKTPRIASVNNPISIRMSTYWVDYSVEELKWNNLKNSKFPLDTYGSLIGNDWDACLGAYALPLENRVAFGVHSITESDSYGVYIGDSDGEEVLEERSNATESYARPLVTLGQGLHITGGDGTASSPWTLSK